MWPLNFAQQLEKILPCVEFASKIESHNFGPT